jgi:aspartate-semialdehyde dehydrogenase
VSGLRTAIAGAGGWIGQHFARLLGDHPWFEPPRLFGGPSTVGRFLEDVWLLPDSPCPESLAKVKLEPLRPRTLERLRIPVVFSALPASDARELEPRLVKRGISVFSNASAHRLDPGVPLLMPEVNADHLSEVTVSGRSGALLVTNPNCSTAGLVLGLAPLRAYLDRRTTVYVSTYQALSGAGYQGVPSLAITDNVVPYIPEEEEKMHLETRKILGRVRRGRLQEAPFEVLAHCARVSSREGHLMSVTVGLKPGAPEEGLGRAWDHFPPARGPDGARLPTAAERPVIWRTEPDRPQPLRDRWAGSPERARGMAVTVGRVRITGRHLRFFLLVHNAVRGGAGGSVLNAELAYARGLLREAA